MFLQFSKTSMSSAFIFQGLKHPLSLSFIGLNVIVFVFLRTQRPLFLCFQRLQLSSALMLYDSNALYFMFCGTSRSSVWFYRTSMSFFFFGFHFFCFLWHPALNSWIAQMKLVQLSLLIFYFQ